MGLDPTVCQIGITWDVKRGDMNSVRMSFGGWILMSRRVIDYWNDPYSVSLLALGYILDGDTSMSKEILRFQNDK